MAVAIESEQIPPDPDRVLGAQCYDESIDHRRYALVDVSKDADFHCADQRSEQRNSGYAFEFGQGRALLCGLQ